MPATSLKHQIFVSEEMGDKPATKVAGIGEVLGERLAEKNYDTAYSLWWEYTMLEGNEFRFKNWLHVMCGANVKQQDDCYRCLKEWTEKFTTL